MEIIFEDRQDFARLDQDIMDKVKAVILGVLAYEGYDDDYEVSLSFVSNDEIREINRDYRKIDKVTDVLSFPMYDGEEVDVDFGAISLGDIVVSIERASDQAKDFGHSQAGGTCYDIPRNIPLFLGYDHMEEEEAKEMRAKEEAVLSQLGITRN